MDLMHSLTAKRVLGSFGHESEPSKQQPPSVKPELLGVEVDLLEERMRLSKRKREGVLRRSGACGRAAHMLHRIAQTIGRWSGDASHESRSRVTCRDERDRLWIPLH